MPDATALRTPRTAMVSSRASSATGTGALGAGARHRDRLLPHITPVGGLDVAEHLRLRRVLEHVVARDLARGAARDDAGEIDVQVAGELADRGLGDDADGCRDPLIREISRSLGLADGATPGLDVAAGAVSDEDGALTGRGRRLGGFAMLALADGRRARGRARRTRRS